MQISLVYILFITMVFVIFIVYENSKYSSIKEGVHKLLNGFKGIFTLNDHSLASQPIFWIGVLLPLFFAGYLEFKILSNSTLALNVTNLDELFKISTIPMYITALTPTLGVIIANIHRTIQTKKQIDNSLEQIDISNRQREIAINQYNLAEKKNISDGYYAHYKYISDEFKGILLIEKTDSTLIALKDRKILVNRPRVLYKKIFNQSNVIDGYNISISTAFITKLSENIKSFVKSVDIQASTFHVAIVSDGSGSVTNKIKKLNSASTNLLNSFGAICNNQSYIEVNYKKVDDKKTVNVVGSLNEIAWGVRKIYDFIVSILDIIDFDRTKSKEIDTALKDFFDIINVVIAAGKIYSEIKN